MKTTVSKTDLRDALAHVMPAVAVKAQTPVLSGIYLEAQGSALTLRATDFSLDITAKIPANVETAGKTVVTGKFFSPIVSKLGGDIVTLQNENNKLTIKSEAASFDVLTMDAGDFPAPLKLEAGTTFNIHRNALKELIRRTAFACAVKDPSRQIFLGVNFILNGSQITAVGTNTQRVAIAKETISGEAEANFIIPATALRSLQIESASSDTVAVEVDKNHAAFAFDNIQLVTRLIDGEFPPCQKVIPETCTKTAEVDVAELRAALVRAQVIAGETKYKSVVLNFTEDGLALSSNSREIGKVLEHVDAEVTGDIRLAMNYHFLADALRVFDSKTINIGMNEPLTPVKITSESDVDFVYVVTPQRI